MILLREYIRTLLAEAAMSPADLPKDVYVTVDSSRKSGTIYVYYSDAHGERIRNMTHRKGYENDIHGGIQATQERHMEGECLNAWMVTASGALHGWGPLLYDVMMEVVGEDGLMADRSSLSNAAFNVWKTYMSRGDVQKKQLDDPGNTLTRDEKDNCEIDTALNHTGSGYSMYDFLSDDWDETDTANLLRTSPVMKVYTKGLTALQQLDRLGRLIEK